MLDSIGSFVLSIAVGYVMLLDLVAIGLLIVGLIILL